MIKLAVLKSGEDVVADVSELVIGERVIGYTFKNPAAVSFLDPQALYEQRDLDIVFAPWIPLTSQKEIPVAPDWIITLVDPIPQVVLKYKEGVKNAESSEVPETSDSGSADLASDGSEC
jgi:hypothetical protein